MTERIKHLWSMCVCVYVCVCVCVRAHACAFQGSTPTTVLSVSLCPNPTPLAPSQRREKTRARLTALFIYIPRSYPISPGELYQPPSDAKNNHSKVKRPLSVFLSLSLLFVLDSQRPPAPIQYFISFSRWFSKDRQEGEETEWDSIM